MDPFRRTHPLRETSRNDISVRPDPRQHPLRRISGPSSVPLSRLVEKNLMFAVGPIIFRGCCLHLERHPRPRHRPEGKEDSKPAAGAEGTDKPRRVVLHGDSNTSGPCTSESITSSQGLLSISAETGKVSTLACLSNQVIFQVRRTNGDYAGKEVPPLC